MEPLFLYLIGEVLPFVPYRVVVGYRELVHFRHSFFSKIFCRERKSVAIDSSYYVE